MKDERIMAIREKVYLTFAMAEDYFESAVLLYESEKYRTSIPLFRDSLMNTIKALLMLEMDSLPDDSALLDSYNQTEIKKDIQSDIEPAEILTKLKEAEQESLDHPLKLSEESIKTLDSCYKQTEHFLARTNKFIKSSLLTTQEFKKKRYIKRLAIMISASLMGIILAAAVIHFILSRGYGLRGEYFADQNFEKRIQTRKDRKIDFDWILGDIVDNFSDNVSIRWTGRIKAPKSGTYKFITNSDDGTRLWIDDKLIIDDWNVHAAEDYGANINLTKGYHQIKLEYFEGEGFASVKLMWIKPGAKSKKVIPSSSLSLGE